MESLIQQIADIGEQIVHFSWLPLLIWTVVSGLVWSIFRTVSRIHPQYQYHIRLALLFSLPAGFLALAVAQLAGNLFLSDPANGLTFISVAPPFEITVSATDASTITTTTFVYLGTFLLFVSGIILFTARAVLQWFQLHKLKSRCNFQPIQEAQGLDDSSLDLIERTDKTIQIAFLKEEIIPVTFGLRQPVILVPDSLKTDQEKLNLVLRHELTHINQNDFLSGIAISLTQIFFWFHPLVHFLKRELIDYREIRCDTVVLSSSSVSKKKYASLLLELLPMPNVNKEFSVNMAQESSNLKKRIHMITQQRLNIPIPGRSSLAIFAVIIISTAIAMACTDMQTDNVFDEEDLNLMTDLDQTGERGYHQVIIFMGEEEQAERHESKLEKLRTLQPEHIQSVEVYKGETAVEKYGSRGEKGVIVINTKLDGESYNTVLKSLGMEPQEVPAPQPPSQATEKQDYFVVVEDMPELIGGLQSLQQEIRYPEMARRAGIEGKVYVQFIVNEQGDVEDAKVIRGIGGGADKEALRVVKEAKFKPGMQRGKPVRVQYTLPIFFQLSSEDNSGNKETSSNLDDSVDGDKELTVVGYPEPPEPPVKDSE